MSKPWVLSSSYIGETGYIDLLKDIKHFGTTELTRNVPTKRLFSVNTKFPLWEGFPLYTARKIFFKGVFEETKFFLQGSTDTTKLSEKGVKIWEKNTSRSFLDKAGLSDLPVGDMGKGYGYNLRTWSEQESCDQLNEAIKLLSAPPPFSRRILWSYWNAANTTKAALPPCHILYVFSVETKDYINYLNLDVSMRSWDLWHGNPFNIAQCALIVELICCWAKVNCPNKFVPGVLSVSGTNAHVYEVHLPLIDELVKRPISPPPTLVLPIPKEGVSFDEYLNDLSFSDVKLEGYTPNPAINAEMVE